MPPAGRTVHHVVGDEILRRCGRIARAVDIGSGTGLSARALLGCADTVVGVDPSVEMLAAAFRHASIGYAAGSAEQLPLASGSFDLATMGSAFHWCDQQAAFAEIDRVVRRDGGAAIYDVELAGLAAAPALIEWLRGEYLDQPATMSAQRGVRPAIACAPALHAHRQRYAAGRGFHDD